MSAGPFINQVKAAIIIIIITTILNVQFTWK